MTNTIPFDLSKAPTGTLNADLLNLCSRAQKLGACAHVIDIAMDIMAAHLAYGVDIDKLAQLDDFSLMHDLSGIHSRIDRANNCFYDDGFLPRSARRQHDD